MPTNDFRAACIASALLLIAAPAARATTFQTEYAFRGGSDGASPAAGLTLAPNGLFYGTTASGGADGYGTIYSFDPAGGGHVVLYSFANGSSGATPAPGLVTDRHGILYGVTEQGGSTVGCNLGCGTVFRFDPASLTLTTLHSFTGGADGAESVARLLLNPGQKVLYGTTVRGGDFSGSCVNAGCGTIFSLSTTGKTFTTLHAFTADADADAGVGPAAALVAGGGKRLYGTASAGGAHGSGTLFVIATDGTGFADLHDFDYHVDGSDPGELLRKGSTLYGTPAAGGTTADATSGTIFSFDTQTNALGTVHGFNQATDGGSPSGRLVPGSGTSLLGTTQEGPGSNSGSVFQFDPKTGATATLNTFSSPGQAVPEGGLTADGTGGYLGSTSYGNGTLYRIVP